jgi:hypothetical protein
MLAIGCSTTDDADRVARVSGARVESRAEPTAGSEPIADPEPPAPEPATDENDPRWHDAFTRVARAYAMWGRVDDELRFAPGLCRMQMPGSARFTASDDEGTHGGAKLYSVFALDPVAYGMPPTGGGGLYTLASTRTMLTGSPSSVPVEDGAALAAFTHSNVVQVLVKESFRPEERTYVPGEVYPGGSRRLSPASRDGRTYFAGEPLGLYVMMRMRDADTPGTDAGWVYGTITPDGTITASGRVRSCMSCHIDAPHDRWFGLPGHTENG